jgi:putative transposase
VQQHSQSRGYRKGMRRQEGAFDVRFMTFSCYRRLPLLDHPGIMDLFVQRMADAKQRLGFFLFAWVIMPEHVHVILRPAHGGTWAEIAMSVKTSVARRVIGRWRELRAPILTRLETTSGEVRFWQPGGGFDRNIRQTPELLHEIQYTHNNPVRRGLVRSADEWRWSSVHWWTGHRNGTLDCDVPPGDPKAWAAWKGFK